jgi:hypothetical protein
LSAAPTHATRRRLRLFTPLIFFAAFSIRRQPLPILTEAAFAADIELLRWLHCFAFRRFSSFSAASFSAIEPAFFIFFAIITVFAISAISRYEYATNMPAEAFTPFSDFLSPDDFILRDAPYFRWLPTLFERYCCFHYYFRCFSFVNIAG